MGQTWMAWFCALWCEFWEGNKTCVEKCNLRLKRYVSRMSTLCSIVDSLGGVGISAGFNSSEHNLRFDWIPLVSGFRTPRLKHKNTVIFGVCLSQTKSNRIDGKDLKVPHLSRWRIARTTIIFVFCFFWVQTIFKANTWSCGHCTFPKPSAKIRSLSKTKVQEKVKKEFSNLFMSKILLGPPPLEARHAKKLLFERFLS